MWLHTADVCIQEDMEYREISLGEESEKVIRVGDGGGKYDHDIFCTRM